MDTSIIDSYRAGPPNKVYFQKVIDEKQCDLFTMDDGAGHQVSITNYGGRIVSWRVSGCDKSPTDIVLGYNSIAGYLTSNESYFGALIGRFGNRIARGRFKLNGKEYHLPMNQPPNHLHGGEKGFHNVMWDVLSHSNNKLELKYWSRNGEERYPGNLNIHVTYTLAAGSGLKIDFKATTDRDTIINVTSHPFFNLSGAGYGTIENHEFRFRANYYTPIDADLIPTGEIAPVAGTPFDFTAQKAICKQLRLDHPQLEYGQGFDHNFVSDRKKNGLLEPVAEVFDRASGRKLEIYTTEPGFQFYTGNALDGSDIGREGRAYEQRSAFCIEPQHFPDSPNQPEFPSTVLHKGDTFRSTSIFRCITT